VAGEGRPGDRVEPGPPRLVLAALPRRLDVVHHVAGAGPAVTGKRTIPIPFLATRELAERFSLDSRSPDPYLTFLHAFGGAPMRKVAVGQFLSGSRRVFALAAVAIPLIFAFRMPAFGVCQGGAFAVSDQHRVAGLALTWPVSPENRSDLGRQYARFQCGNDQCNHTGLGIAVTSGTAAVAAADGRVRACPMGGSGSSDADNHNMGNVVIIDTSDGPNPSGPFTRT
jgi:hypothetical protein